MLNKIIGVFLILHSLAHAGLAAAPIPNDPDPKPGTFFTASARSWLMPKLGFQAGVIQWTGIVLVILSTLGFILAGAGLLGLPGLSTIWRTVAVGSASLSLLLLLLFWHPWIVIGVLLDIAILISIFLIKWSPEI